MAAEEHKRLEQEMVAANERSRIQAEELVTAAAAEKVFRENQMQAQIEQLNGALQQQQGTLQSAMTENKRLVGVVKQTDKAAQASPSLNDMQDNQNKVKASLQQQGQ